MAFSDWSTTAGSNTSVGGVNIAEGSDPGDVNDAIRAMMAELKAGAPYLSTTFRFTATATPNANDGAALGTTSLMWSDLFLASGAVINFNNGDVTLTHSSNQLNVAGGDLSVESVVLHPAIPQVSKSEDYTLVLTDAQKHIYHPAGDNNPRTFTIPANASVAFPIGTTITFVNEVNTLSIAITSDTLVLAGTGSTGTRTIAANGQATAIKVTSTRWRISGVGIS